MPTNSWKEGTELSLSLKYVGRGLGADGGASGVRASVVRERVASEGVWRTEQESWRRGGALRHRNRVAADAIASVWKLRCPEVAVEGDLEISK